MARLTYGHRSKCCLTRCGRFVVLCPSRRWRDEVRAACCRRSRISPHSLVPTARHHLNQYCVERCGSTTTCELYLWRGVGWACLTWCGAAIQVCATHKITTNAAVPNLPDGTKFAVILINNKQYKVTEGAVVAADYDKTYSAGETTSAEV